MTAWANFSAVNHVCSYFSHLLELLPVPKVCGIVEKMGKREFTSSTCLSCLAGSRSQQDGIIDLWQGVCRTGNNLTRQIGSESVIGIDCDGRIGVHQRTSPAPEMQLCHGSSCLYLSWQPRLSGIVTRQYYYCVRVAAGFVWLLRM